MATNGYAQEHPKGIDEDEAALYDRQIRLWGVEAQNRMKTAAVLIVNLRGLAVEVCKNIVLAGIGSLTIVDDQDVSEEDLGTNYFVRDEEVGHKVRVDAAVPRIQALNPRVKVVARTSRDILNNKDALSKYDLICVTDSDSTTITNINDLCRLNQHTKFYAGASLGSSGYVFADLLDHDFTVQRPDPKAKSESGMEPPKIAVKKHQVFAPFSHAVQHTWKDAKPKLKPKHIRKMTPLFEVLALLHYQSVNNGQLPQESSKGQDLASAMQKIVQDKGIDAPSDVVDLNRLTALAATASADFSASCAVLGGVLAQDILNALGGRETPLINFLVFDGSTCNADIYAMGVSRTI